MDTCEINEWTSVISGIACDRQGATSPLQGFVAEAAALRLGALAAIRLSECIPQMPSPHPCLNVHLFGSKDVPESGAYA